jgi:protein disulfide-isomerase
MRSIVLTLALLALSGPALADDGWGTDYAKALEQARKQKKPILADFTGSDWCHWCKVLHKEVFDTAEFKAWAKKRVILLEVDFPARKPQPAKLKAQNQRLQRKFKIEGYPTIVFISPDEKEIGRYGYDRGGPAVWLKKADAILAKAPKSPAPKPKPKPNPPSPTPPKAPDGK